MPIFGFQPTWTNVYITTYCVIYFCNNCPIHNFFTDFSSLQCAIYINTGYPQKWNFESYYFCCKMKFFLKSHFFCPGSHFLKIRHAFGNKYFHMKQCLTVLFLAIYSISSCCPVYFRIIYTSNQYNIVHKMTSNMGCNFPYGRSALCFFTKHTKLTCH